MPIITDIGDLASLGRHHGAVGRILVRKITGLSRAVKSCARISSEVRLRTSFCVPVWQKEQGERAADL